ncbi:MAG: quinol:cytochrome C oxidoreductase [Planctomycetes bacterium]|nr:quinol:cytochrome C oxidoreductase [Planctomycetota bacterium]
MKATHVAIPDDEIRIGRGMVVPAIACAFVGVAALGAGVLIEGFPRFLAGYLASLAFWLSISLGALFFVLIQHLTRSGWSVTVRRIAENLAANVLPLAVLFVPVIVGLSDLYHWTHPGEDPLLREKSAWLDPAFFTARAGICFAVWVVLSRFFLANSARQDASGDVALTHRMQRFAPAAMILYALTVTMAAFDLLMSRDPHWFSTIFGVYYFSGGLVAFFAVLVIAVYLLQSSGRLTRSVTTEHYHDMGKQLFGYLVFWAYIAFSQYMLIWYANIPEETRWYLDRQHGSAAGIGLFLVLGQFALPFLALLPRRPKRTPALLAGIAAWILVGRFLDCFFIVSTEFGLAEVFCFFGIGGLFVAALLFRMSKTALLPARDPRLPEALSFENL